MAAAAAFVLAELAPLGVDEEPAWKLALMLGLVALVGALTAATTWPLSPDDGPAVLWLYWIAIVLSGRARGADPLSPSGTESDADENVRFMAALAIAAVLATLLQPIVRRLQRQPAGGELVLRLDRGPSDEAVVAAVEALGRHGVGAVVVGRPRV